MSQQFFAVKNLERFQHYKDRRPPWIKLYQDVLEDYAFTRLPDASKMHLLAIWLLASRTTNKVPFDPAWIATAIHATEPVNLDLLLSAGFITLYDGASELLAVCQQVATPETETEVEKETDVGGGVVGVVIGETADYALHCTIAANKAVTKRWGEQTRPYLANGIPAHELAQSLREAGVSLETAKTSIAQQVDRSAKRTPPTTVKWFLNGILEAHGLATQRAAEASVPREPSRPDPAREAEVEFQRVHDLVSSVGDLRFLAPEKLKGLSPRVFAALKPIGGLAGLKQVRPDKVVWARKDFIAAYRAAEGAA